MIQAKDGDGEKSISETSREEGTVSYRAETEALRVSDAGQRAN